MYWVWSHDDEPECPIEHRSGTRTSASPLCALFPVHWLILFPCDICLPLTTGTDSRNGLCNQPTIEPNQHSRRPRAVYRGALEKSEMWWIMAVYALSIRVHALDDIEECTEVSMRSEIEGWTYALLLKQRLLSIWYDHNKYSRKQVFHRRTFVHRKNSEGPWQLPRTAKMCL